MSGAMAIGKTTKLTNKGLTMKIFYIALIAVTTTLFLLAGMFSAVFGFLLAMSGQLLSGVFLVVLSFAIFSSINMLVDNSW